MARHAGHAGGVRHRQIITVAEGVLALDGELPALVQSEGAVLDPEDVDALDAPCRRGHLGGVTFRAAIDDDVARHGGAVRGDDLDADQAPSGRAYGGGQVTQLSRLIADAGPEPDREGGEGSGHRPRLVNGVAAAA